MNSVSVSRLLLVLTALLFSTGGVAIKLARLSAWQVASFRSAVAAVALIVLVPVARRGWSWRVIPAGLAYTATLLLFVMSTKMTTAANAIFLQATAPLYMLLFGPLLLHERLKRSDLALAAAAAAGIAAFFFAPEAAMETAPEPVRGNILGALSGIAWALTITCLRWLGKSTRSGEGALASVVAGNSFAFLIALPLALPVHGARPLDWGILVYLGVVQIGLAYLLLTRAVRHVPAFEATSLLLLEPVVNPVWAWLVVGERPGAWALAGGGLILGATFLHTWHESRRHFRPAPSRV
ncbi:MAG TPA: DMT family transporter [Bryobacteraceae bacterium]|nr:DMT family transporter [Bryobacteraceae bacterium]